MLDLTPLDTAVERLAGKLRAAPQSALRRGAAAEGLELARELARRAQRIEFPDREPAELPDAGVFVVGDQVAVAGHDLAEALRTARGDAGDAGREFGEAVALVEAATARSGL
ncbi:MULTISPECIES: hypothetical protein [unclassified Streptomyces]|uniref:hypothetical protein n=1 Tax=unclassified Streptomyces TaxID=2593676 RepID=UPI000BFA59B2|nr:hypothetical protein [Streptomyces sp. Ru87]PGH50031.1 hypothetical protein CRI70_14320 [Streptomyces sp. Ru87]